MKNILILLTNSFPFGNGESFVKNEISYYSKFDSVLIIPKMEEGDLINTKFQSNTKIFSPIVLDKNRKLVLLILVFSKIYFWKEFIEIIFSKTSIFYKSRQLILFCINGLHYSKSIQKALEKMKINSNNSSMTFYSYWLMEGAFAATLLNKTHPNSKVISRVHRYDLYTNRQVGNYIPMREFILKNIDEVFSISTDGLNYLKNKYPSFENKFSLSKLGTDDFGFSTSVKLHQPLKLVSCSWLKSIKRVDRIISALSLIKDVEIEWTHFGSGALFDYIKQKAVLELSSNIKTIFLGSLTNEEIIEDYISNDYHVFLNVSESEGIPVSIMEALSFGIPIIATNVGGVNEIVKDGMNGFLLEKDFNDNDLVDKLLLIFNFNEEEYQNMRERARKFWENNYSAQMNYSEFKEFL
ncbi:MAG TPA: glycosyltransferase [Lutibacter sp.]